MDTGEEAQKRSACPPRRTRALKQGKKREWENEIICKRRRAQPPHLHPQTGRSEPLHQGGHVGLGEGRGAVPHGVGHAQLVVFDPAEGVVGQHVHPLHIGRRGEQRYGGAQLLRAVVAAGDDGQPDDDRLADPGQMAEGVQDRGRWTPRCWPGAWPGPSPSGRRAPGRPPPAPGGCPAGPGSRSCPRPPGCPPRGTGRSAPGRRRGNRWPRPPPMVSPPPERSK